MSATVAMGLYMRNGALNQGWLKIHRDASGTRRASGPEEKRRGAEPVPSPLPPPMNGRGMLGYGVKVTWVLREKADVISLPLRNPL